MAVLQLRYFPDDVLRVKTQPITAFDDELKRFVADMAETMYAEAGIGLAANQVGRSVRLLVMDVPRSNDDKSSNFKAMLNPEIVARDGSQNYEEGCLSFPGIQATVKRALNVTVVYQNANGETHEERLTGLEAVCLQHEMDHLDGITFVDYLSPLKRRLLLRDLKRNLIERGIVEEAAL